MNRISKVFIAIGIILVLAALYMVIDNVYEDYYAGDQSSKILDKMEDLDINRGEADSNEIKVVDIDGYGIVGTITIPAIDIKLPVMSKFDYNRMKKAPCLYYGSVETNDLVICSHGFKRHFGNLYKLQPKDVVVFTDMYGTEYYYEVELVEELKGTNIKEMLDSEFDLTLFTCTKDGNSRVTVRCNRVNV